MSRVCLWRLCLGLTAVSLVSVVQADELFSRMRTETVFDPTSSATPGGSAPAAEQLSRFANLTKLQEGLRDSGLEPSLENGNALAISLQHSRWTFPIRLELTDQAEQVVLLLALEPADKKPLPADRLTGLLAANGQIRPAAFTFNVERKRLELVVPVLNQNLTVRSLREEIRNLAALAEKTSPLWDAPTTSSAPAPTAKQNAPQPPVAQQSAKQSSGAPAGATNSLAGKWLGNRGSETFSLQLNLDNTFELLHTKGGRSNKSTGRFEFAGRQLTLTGGDGVKISGEVANLAARSFDFSPGGSAGKLSFQRTP